VDAHRVQSQQDKEGRFLQAQTGLHANMKPTSDEEKRVALAVREIVARFVEEANADSVVVMWTSNSKIGTKAKITTWGNQFAIRDMIKTASDDYCIERINAIKLKIDKKPKPKDEP
jgi:hypothetical protein